LQQLRQRVGRACETRQPGLFRGSGRVDPDHIAQRAL